MSVLAATVLILLGVGTAIWFWRSAPRDMDTESDALAGRQGRCEYWMKKADTPPPIVPATWTSNLSSPADRVLTAMIRHHGTDDADTKEAHRRLKAAHPAGVAGLFARGRMEAANRVAARRHFRGPGALFALWYIFVYRIRRGPRGVHLETLCQALEETRS